MATTFGRGIWKTEGHVYIDEDNTAPVHTEKEDGPFENVSDAEGIQAHSQTRHMDGDTYQTQGGITITTRLGHVKRTGTGPVIIK